MLSNTVPNLSNSCYYLLNTYYVFTCFSPFNLKRQPYDKAIFISIFQTRSRHSKNLASLSCRIKIHPPVCLISRLVFSPKLVSSSRELRRENEFCKVTVAGEIRWRGVPQFRNIWAHDPKLECWYYRETEMPLETLFWLWPLLGFACVHTSLLFAPTSKENPWCKLSAVSQIF